MYENRRKPGRMGPFVEGYRSRLLSMGYTPGTVGGQLKALGQIGRWMQAEVLESAQLDEAQIELFLSSRRAEGHPRVPSLRSFVALLEYLRDEHVIAPVAGAPVTAFEELVGSYREWLSGERGLAPSTVLRYENLARRFLREHGSGADGVDVRALTGVVVSGFVLAECARVSRGAVKGRITELRSLLRFLYLRGLTPMTLAPAVPAVAGWRDTAIPQTLTAADVQALIDSCDRSRTAGIRDFAILVLVARLGLRSVEVARMQLWPSSRSTSPTPQPRSQAPDWPKRPRRPSAGNSSASRPGSPPPPGASRSTCQWTGHGRLAGKCCLPAPADHQSPHPSDRSVNIGITRTTSGTPRAARPTAQPHPAAQTRVELEPALRQGSIGGSRLSAFPAAHAAIPRRELQIHGHIPPPPVAVETLPRSGNSEHRRHAPVLAELRSQGMR